MVKNKRGPDGLTDFERNICNALYGGMTYREAYRAVRPDSKASDKTAESCAWRVYHRPHCVAYAKQLTAKTLARRDRIIEELALVAFSDIGDVMSWGPEGLTVKPFDELAPASAALSRVSVTKMRMAARCV